MGNRIFIFGDIHFKNESREWLKYQESNLYYWIVENYKKYDCNSIIFLGDRFKERDPEGDVRDRCDDLFYELSRLSHIIAIVGNHDMYLHTSGSHSLNNYGILKRINNITIIDTATKIEDMEFIPWGYEPSGEGKYLFGHFEVKEMFPWSKDGVSWEEKLKGYNRVILGHIHDYMSWQNVQYIGVPFQRNFADGLLTGGLVLDTATDTINRVDGYGRKFVLIKSKDDIGKLEGQEKAFARVLSDKDLYHKIKELPQVDEVEFMPLISDEPSDDNLIKDKNYDDIKSYTQWVEDYVVMHKKGEDYIDFAKKFLEMAGGDNA